MRTTGVLLTIFFFVIVACKSRIYDCQNAFLSTTFIGYSESEVDTLYLRKYQPNTNFSSFIKTDTVSTKNYLRLYTRRDSIDAFAYGGSGIEAGYDWELVIPAVSKTIRVSNIVFEKRQGKYTKKLFSENEYGCTNPVYSATLDNVVINYTDGNTTLYFHK